MLKNDFISLEDGANKLGVSTNSLLVASVEGKIRVFAAVGAYGVPDIGETFDSEELFFPYAHIYNPIELLNAGKAMLSYLSVPTNGNAEWRTRDLKLPICVTQEQAYVRNDDLEWLILIYGDESIPMQTEIKSDGQNKRWDEAALKELVEFRKTHTVEETAQQFGIGNSRVYELARKYKEEHSEPTAHNPFGIYNK